MSERVSGERGHAGNAHVSASGPAVRAPTAAELAADRVDVARRDVDELEAAIRGLRDAHAGNDSARWVDVRTRIDRLLAKSASTLETARGAIADSPELLPGLAAAETKLAQQREEASGLVEPPLGWKAMPREAELMRIVTDPASAGWDDRVRALEHEVDQLSAADCLALTNRLRRRAANDPFATALATRATPERSARLLDHLALARRRDVTRRQGPTLENGAVASPPPRPSAAVVGPVETIDDILRQVLENDAPVDRFTAFDSTARRELASRLEAYRPGNGDELAARVARLERDPRQQILAALRSNAPRTYPFHAQIQASFGAHDIGDLRSSTSSEAADNGARAFTRGGEVTFGETPDLHLAAHEAAHAVLQRAGVAPVADGQAGDSYERHADSVADRVTRGESAEALLSTLVPPAPTARSAPNVIQRKEQVLSAASYVGKYAHQVIQAIDRRIHGTPLDAPHPRLPWSRTRDPHDVISKAIRAYLDVPVRGLLDAVARLADPASVEAMLEEAGTHHTAPGWRPDVGQILATSLDVPIATSLRRMGPRLRAQLDVRDDHVRGSDVVASSVLDAVIADALTEPGVLAPAPRLKGGHRDTGADDFSRGSRDVTFRWLGGEDPTLWCWIEVLSPKAATVEDVARTPLDDRDRPDGSQDAAKIVASGPFFKIPVERAIHIRAAIDHAPPEVRAQLQRGPASGVVASSDALASSTHGDDAALAQAPIATAADPAPADSIGRLRLQLGFVKRLAAPWHLPNALWASEAFVGRRAAELAQDPRKAARWAPVLAGQERTLHAVSSELAQLLVDNRVQATPSLGPVAAVVEAYLTAASVAHLLAQGTDALANARRSMHQLPLALAEEHVRAAASAVEAQRADEASVGQAAVGSDDTTAAVERLRARDANLRLTAARTANIDADELDDLAADADIVALRARIHSLQSQVLDLEAQAIETGLATKRYEGGLPTVHALGDQLRLQATTWIGELAEVGNVTFAPSADGAPTSRRRAARKRRGVVSVQSQMAAFGKRAEIGAYLSWAKTQIADQRFHNKVNDFLLQLGLMVVTMQLGSGLASAARGLAVGLELMSAIRSGGVVFKIAETAAQAALAVGGQAMTGADVGLRDFAENGLAMVLTEAAMKPFAGMFQVNAAVAAEAKTLSQRAIKTATKLGRNAAHIATESGVSIGASKVARMAMHGGELDAASTEEVVSMGLSIAAGRIVGHRMEEAHERLAQAAEARGAEHLAKLRDRARELSHRARATQQPSREEALALIADEHRLLVEERAAYEAAPGNDKAAKANRAAIDATDARFLDVPLQLAGLDPVVDGHVYEGDWHTVEKAFKAAADAGLVLHSVWDAAANTWHIKVGDRVVDVHVREAAKGAEHAKAPARAQETKPDASAKQAPARASGHAGPDLHTHMMGVLDPSYFVAKLGSGDAVVAFEKIRALLADPATKAKHARKIADRTHAALESHRATGASKEQLALEATAGIETMLAAGEETPFDHPYKIRQLIVETLIDPGAGPYKSYTRDTMAELAKQGIGYSEQSVGLDKLDEKFPEDMMHDLHREAAAKGKDVDIRFLAMVPTTTLAGKVTPELVADSKVKLANILKRGDVIGIDVAAPEKHAFTADGMKNFEELYDLVAAAAAERGRPLVLRPHVGEGYNEGTGSEHAKLAEKNLETMITALEHKGYSPARAEKDGVIIRFGHATHATADQVQRMAKLGVIVEANLGSNVVTKSIEAITDHPLLINLYYGVRTVLGTDGGGVMGTSRESDYAGAQRIIDTFRNGEKALRLPEGIVEFKNLDETTRRRFTVEFIRGVEDAYHTATTQADARDTANRTKVGRL